MNWTEEQVRALAVAPDQMEAIRRARAIRPRMNKWEWEYQRSELEPRRLVGEVLWYAFEPFKLRLADKTYYTPDFAVLVESGLELHEVKGFWREDARVKIKVAAELFPFAFVVITKGKDGEWRREHFRGRG